MPEADASSKQGVTQGTAVRYVEVAVDVPMFSSLTYGVPRSLNDLIRPGQLVQVPFRNRAKTGLVMSIADTLEDPSLEGKVRNVLDIVDPEPLLHERGLEFLTFVADYYLSPIGEVVRLALPSSVRIEGIKCYQRCPEPCPDPMELEKDLREVLEFIGDDVHSIQDIKKKFTKLTFLRLGVLEELGYVQTTYQEEHKVKAAQEKYYKVVHPRKDVNRVGAKQQEILDLFTEQDQELSLSEIKESVASPYSSLRGLVDREILTEEEREVYRDPFASEPVPEKKEFALTTTQQHAVDEVRKWRERGKYRGFVLHGVTGSGKTEVYARIIKETLAMGKCGVILLPEIALTPQFVAVFRSHFGDRIAVLHSGLTRAEKFDQWRRIKRDEVEIVIGARSAIFAPLDRLGVIIVDEEHDPSFKQGEGTRYNARDMALVRGKLEGAQVILGSATPSLESYHNAVEDRLTYLPMPERVASRPLPKVDLVDMRQGAAKAGGTIGLLSRALTNAIGHSLQDEMQSILFLNRRGYSPCIICEECGHLWMCPNCDVSLTYHRHQESLRCHYCDYSLPVPESCPACGALGPNGKGVGTEQLAEQISMIFSNIRVGRLDRDTSQGKGLRKIIKNFRQGELDLLVGTQMVTKGHDFPKVTTVGVVSADLSLNFPDFRASERTFQLMTQVAGRAGRDKNEGKVFIQTYNPDHYSLVTAQKHDFKAFAERELHIREEIAYPPFGHLIALKFESASEGGASQAARDYSTAARRHLRQNKQLGDGVFMLGPALAPMARLKGKYRWQILFKSRSRALVRKLAIATLGDVGFFETVGSTHKNVRIIVDVDPLSML